MATYSNNTTIKIGETVGVSVSIIGSTNDASNSYTVPSGCYLKIINRTDAFSYSGYGSNYYGYVKAVIPYFGETTFLNGNTLPAGAVINTVVHKDSYMSSAIVAAWCGVLFKNTP